MSRAKAESTKDTLTKYKYDKNGRLQKIDYVEDKLNSTNIKTYTYEYDTIGRLTKTIKPDKECSQYSYDNMNKINKSIILYW